MKANTPKWLGLTAAVSIMLTGCGSNPPTGGETPPASPAASPVQQTTVDPTPSPSTSPLPSPEAKKIMYRMSDKTYRFSPVDKDAPDKAVLLSFDDGPKKKEELTSLLDTLDKHKAKAIFFVNGYRVKENPSLLKLIDQRGQTIGNHSWDHIDLHKMSKAEVQKQTRRRFESGRGVDRQAAAVLPSAIRHGRRRGQGCGQG